MNILIIKPQHETIKYFQPTKMATLVALVVAHPRFRHKVEPILRLHLHLIYIQHHR